MLVKNNFLDLRYSKFHGHFGLDSKTPQRKGFCCYTDPRWCVYEAGLIFIKNYPVFGIKTYDKILKTYLKDRFIWTCYSKFSFLPQECPGSLLEYAQFIYELAFYLHPRHMRKEVSFNVDYVYSVLKLFNFDKYVR